MHRHPAILLLLTNLLASHGKPTPKFEPVSTGLRHSAGTAAQISPDGSVLYVTSDDGTVLAINPTDGSEIWRNRTEGAEVCRSGVSFSADGSKFVVAVSDTSGSTGRVVAYDHPSNGLPLWRSEALQGVPSGTPVFGSDEKYVYLTHNFDGQGIFSVLSIEDGVPFTVFSQGFKDLRNYTTIATAGYAFNNMEWSPVGIARKPTPDGNYRAGEGNTNDLVLWAHVAIDGSSVYDGFTYAFQFPMTNATAPEIAILAKVKWSTWTSPVFSADGQEMFFSGSRSHFRGWVDGQGYHLGANTKINPDRTGPNPVRSALALSPDGSRAFFATTKKQFWAADVGTPGLPGENRTLWSLPDLSAVLEAGARVTPNGGTVHIFTGSGWAHAIEAATGDIIWNVEPAEPVSAEFSLSANGTELFFVGTEGTVSAWDVSGAIVEVPEKTEAPTPMGTRAPSSALTAASAPSPTEAPVGTDVGGTDGGGTDGGGTDGGGIDVGGVDVGGIDDAAAPTPAPEEDPTPQEDVPPSSAPSLFTDGGIRLVCAAAAWTVAAVLWGGGMDDRGRGRLGAKS